VRNNSFSDQEKVLKFEDEGREFAKILRSIQQFIGIVKGQNNFWNKMHFLLIPGDFSDLNTAK
jgi:hypothetical protein